MEGRATSLMSLFKIFIYLAASDLSCGMWDLVPLPGVGPRPLHWEHSLSHCTTREVLDVSYKGVTPSDQGPALMTSSNYLLITLVTSQRAHLQILLQWRLRLQHMNFQGTQIFSPKYFTNIYDMAFNTSTHESVYFLPGTRSVNQMQCFRRCDGSLVIASLFT